jgi:cytochrome c-type biogenesis protein CcmH/NrfG
MAAVASAAAAPGASITPPAPSSASSSVASIAPAAPSSKAGVADTAPLKPIGVPQPAGMTSPASPGSASTSAIAQGTSGTAGAPTPAASGAAAIGPFAAVFGGILAIGVVVTILIMRQMPSHPMVQTSAPPAPPSEGAADTDNGASFPPGHPTVQIPKEALDFIKQLEQKANANPNDLAAWDQLGDVTLRAAAFDPSYYPRASNAYAHVLKIDPENLDALRGVGNIDFDQRKFDEAIAAYEHYLSKKPDDPDVRTDLGTMYLSTNNADQAVIQYKKVLAAHPQFFEAAFNLGVAYGQMNQMADARTALATALKLAPDGEARNRVNQMIASLATPPATVADSAPPLAPGATPPSSGDAGIGSAPSSASADNTGGAGAAPSANASVAAGTFQGAMEQMLRDLPIAGPKVQSLQWPSPTKARVLMDNFPMDQMPPFAAAKFMTDLKAGIDQVKTAHKIGGPVEVDICDASSGRVMQTVTE